MSEDAQLKLRVPVVLKVQIDAASKANGRSINAEVVARLEKSLEDDAEAREVADLVREHESQISELWAKVEKLEALAQAGARWRD